MDFENEVETAYVFPPISSPVTPRLVSLSPIVPMRPHRAAAERSEADLPSSPIAPRAPSLHLLRPTPIISPKIDW